MILPVFLYNTREPGKRLLLDCLASCSVLHGVPLDVNVDEKEANALLKMAAQQTQGVLFLIGVDELKAQEDLSPLKLSRNLVRSSRNHLVVLVLQTARDLEDVLSVSSRLAGVLCCPINEKRAGNIFGMALREYASNVQMAGMQQLDARAVVLKSGNKDYRLKVDQILYAQALSKKIEVVCTHQTLQLYASMEEILELLGEGFVRCHRSYVINLKKVAQVDWTQMLITLSDASSIPVSRSWRSTLKEVLS